MLGLKSIFVVLATLTLLSSVHAGSYPLVKRNQEPSQPSCTNFTPFKYAGCFSDSGSTGTLLFDGPRTNNMTVETCVVFCKGNDYKYAGLEYYGECFCGASVNGLQVNESFCNFPCSGDRTETCGANKYINIYQDTTFPTVDSTIISDYMPMGCYSEGSVGRSLAWRQYQLSTTNLTIETCLHACKLGGFSFAGVEYAQECYCGVVLGNGTLPVNSTKCNSHCTGNSSEICGGASILNLFLAKDLESTQPCTGGNSTSSSSSIVYSSTTSSSSTSSSLLPSTTPSSSQLSSTSTITSVGPPTTSPTPSAAPSSSTVSITSTSSSSSSESSSITSNFFSSSSSIYSPPPTTSSSYSPPAPPSTSSSSVPVSSSTSSSTNSGVTTSSTSLSSISSAPPSTTPSSSSSSSSSSFPSSPPTTSSSTLSSSSTSSSSTSSSSTSSSSTSSSSTSSSSTSSSSTSSSSTSSSSTSSSSKSSSSISSSSSSSTSLSPTPPTSTSSSVSSTSSLPPTTSSSFSTLSSSSYSPPPTTSSTSSSSSISSSSVYSTSTTCTTSSSSALSLPPTTSSCSTLTTSSTYVTPTITSAPPPPPTTSTTSTSTAAFLCTSTIVISPTPTCEYKCGKWCSTPLPTFGDSNSCWAAFSSCEVQLSSCFLEASFPDSLNCWEFSSWCNQVSSYCGSYCPGTSCSKNGCTSKYPPSGPPTPSPTTSFSVYTCPPQSTSTIHPSTTSSPTSSTSCIPIPTNSNVCTQPNNPTQGYSSDSPVGGIALPCLTCNNLWSDFFDGNPFKLYTSFDSTKCPSYQRSGPDGPNQGCKDACDSQYESCVNTYAASCKNTKGRRMFGDTYQTATQKCSNQRSDCYSTNWGVTGSGRCGSWNTGWW